VKTLPARTHLAALALTAALAASLSACGDPDQPAADAAGADSGADSGHPFTVDNCGTEVTVTEAPERIVTIKSTSTELVLALGLGERLVGTAFADGPVLEQWADDAADVPVLSEQAPTQEVVLVVEPDLVFAGWESNFAADTAGERDTLAQLGVQTYVSPAACQEEGYQPRPMTYEKLFDQFGEAGRLLGAEDAAAELVTEQRAALAEVGKAEPGTTALWWSSGEDTPFVGGTIGAPQMVLDAVGLDNVVTEDATWTSLGWEAIVDADPDVLVLVDAAWNTAEQKIEALEASAATRELAAVRNERYLVIPFPAAEAGVRSVGAAADLAQQLDELGLAAQ
jgi:iron complex transport system substrate-binding protein